MLNTHQCRLVGADCMLEDNSRRYMTFAAPTIISCKYYYILLLWRRTIEISIQDGGLIKGQKNANHHTSRPSTWYWYYSRPPIFSLVTTFKLCKHRSVMQALQNPLFCCSIIGDLFSPSLCLSPLCSYTYMWRAIEWRIKHNFLCKDDRSSPHVEICRTWLNMLNWWILTL